MKLRTVLLLATLLVSGLVPAALHYAPDGSEPGTSDPATDSAGAAAADAGALAAADGPDGVARDAPATPDPYAGVPDRPPLFLEATTRETPVDVLRDLLAASGVADDATPYPPTPLSEALDTHPLWEGGPVPPLPARIDRALGALIVSHAELTRVTRAAHDGTMTHPNQLAEAALRFSATVEATAPVLRTLPGVEALRTPTTPDEVTVPATTIPNALAHLYTAIGAPVPEEGVAVPPSGLTPEGDAMLGRAIEATAVLADAQNGLVRSMLGPEGQEVLGSGLLAMHALSLRTDNHEPVDGETLNEALEQMAGFLDDERAQVLGAVVTLQRALQDLTGLPVEVVQVNDDGDVGIVFRDPLGLVWVTGPGDDHIGTDAGYCVQAGAATNVVGGAVANYVGNPPPDCLPIRGPGQALLLVDTGGDDTYTAPIASADPFNPKIQNFSSQNLLPPPIPGTLQDQGVADEDEKLSIPGNVDVPGAGFGVCVSNEQDDPLLYGFGAERPHCRVAIGVTAVFPVVAYDSPLTLAAAVDVAGNDTYQNETIGYAGPLGAAVLMDLEGDDAYDVERGLGLAYGNGFAYFADLEGDDAYVVDEGLGAANYDFTVRNRAFEAQQYVGNSTAAETLNVLNALFGFCFICNFNEQLVVYDIAVAFTASIPFVPSGAIDANGTDEYELGALSAGSGVPVLGSFLNYPAAFFVDAAGVDSGLLEGTPANLHLVEPHVGRFRLWAESILGPATFDDTSGAVIRFGGSSLASYRTAVDVENRTDGDASAFEEEDGYVVGPLFARHSGSYVGIMPLQLPPIVMIEAKGDTVHERSASILIDAAGNDTYVGVPGVNEGPNLMSGEDAASEAAYAPRVVVDLVGHDTYKATRSGLAVAGVVDADYKDQRVVGNETLFSAVFDFEGDDTYDATDGPLGAAYWPRNYGGPGAFAAVLDWNGRDTAFGGNLSFGAAEVADGADWGISSGGTPLMTVIAAFIGTDAVHTPEIYTATNKSLGYAYGWGAIGLFAHVAPSAPAQPSLGSAGGADASGDVYAIQEKGLGAAFAGDLDGFGDHAAGISTYEVPLGPIAVAVGPASDDAYTVRERTAMGWLGTADDEDIRDSRSNSCQIEGGQDQLLNFAPTLAARSATQSIGPRALFLEIDGHDAYRLDNLEREWSEVLEWDNDKYWQVAECTYVTDGTNDVDPTYRRMGLGMDQVRTAIQRIALAGGAAETGLLGDTRSEVTVKVCTDRRDCDLADETPDPLVQSVGSSTDELEFIVRGVATASAAPQRFPEACDEDACVAKLGLTYVLDDEEAVSSVLSRYHLNRTLRQDSVRLAEGIAWYAGEGGPHGTIRIQIKTNFTAPIRPCTTSLNQICIWESRIDVPVMFEDDRDRRSPIPIALPGGTYEADLVLTDVLAYETGVGTPIIEDMNVQVDYRGLPAGVIDVRGTAATGGAGVVYDAPVALGPDRDLQTCFSANQGTRLTPWEVRELNRTFDARTLTHRVRVLYDAVGNVVPPDDNGTFEGTAWIARSCEGAFLGSALTRVRTGPDSALPTIEQPLGANATMVTFHPIDDPENPKFYRTWVVHLAMNVHDPVNEGLGSGNEVFIEGEPTMRLGFSDGTMVWCGDDGVRCDLGTRTERFKPSDHKTIYFNATFTKQRLDSQHSPLKNLTISPGLRVLDGALRSVDVCPSGCTFQVDIDLPRSRLRFTDPSASGFLAVGAEDVPLEWEFVGTDVPDVELVSLQARPQNGGPDDWFVVDEVVDPGTEAVLTWTAAAAGDATSELFLLRAVAVDDAGNREKKFEDSVDLILAYDVETPTALAVTQTAASKTSATVAGSFSEAVTARARLVGDNATLQVHTEPARSHSFTFAGLEPGQEVDVLIETEDLAGNPLNVTVPVQTSPSIRVGVLEPAPGTTVTGRTNLSWLSGAGSVESGGDPSIEATFELRRGDETCSRFEMFYTETTGSLFEPAGHGAVMDTRGCQDGEWTLVVAFANSEQSVDFAIPVTVDNTDPEVDVQADGPEGRAGWHRGSVKVTAAAIDAGGANVTIASPSVRANRTVEGDIGFTIAQDGSHRVFATASDTAGHVVRRVEAVKIDATPPVGFVSLRAAGNGVVGVLNAVDAASGPAFFRATVGDGEPGTWIPLRAGETLFPIEVPESVDDVPLVVEIEDVAGNQAMITSALEDPTAPPAVLGGVSVQQLRPSSAVIAYRTEDPTITSVLVSQADRLWTITDTDRRTAHRVTIDGLEPATEATITVLTEGRTGARIEAAQITVTTPKDVSAPGVVSDVAATLRPDGSVTLAWTAPPDDGAIDHYIVSRAIDGEATTHTTTAPAFVDAASAPGQSITYTVAAVDMAGNQGPASQPITVEPRTRPRVVDLVMDPPAGTPETVFRFTAVVNDADGDIPRVRLTVGDKVLPMVVDDRTDEGLVFVASTRLPAGVLANPVPAVLVTATDGAFNATYPPSGLPMRGPVVTITSADAAATPGPGVLLVLGALLVTPFALRRRRRDLR